MPGGEPFRADEDRPPLDAHRDELLRAHPRIAGEPTVDVGFDFRIDDQQHANTSLFASGERAAEEDEAVVCERVHERRVLVYRGLLVDPPYCPGGSGFADDGEEAHARAMR